MQDIDLSKLWTSLLEHSVADIRIASLNFMIASSRPNDVLPPEALSPLRRFIPGFHHETDPRIRNGFIALTKLIFGKLEQAAKTFSRVSSEAGNSHTDLAEERANMWEHMNLARWYQRFLWNELRPTASYQSHITALKVLLLMFPSDHLLSFLLSNRQPHPDVEQAESRSVKYTIFDHLRPLLDLLTNPFDDVRQSAFEILSLILPSDLHSGRVHKSSNYIGVYLRTHQAPQAQLVSWVEIAIARANGFLQCTGRADLADGVGRLYDLYQRISKSESCPSTIKDKEPLNTLLTALEFSLKKPGQEGSCEDAGFVMLHGYLIALR